MSVEVSHFVQHQLYDSVSSKSSPRHSDEPSNRSATPLHRKRCRQAIILHDDVTAELSKAPGGQPRLLPEAVPKPVSTAVSTESRWCNSRLISSPHVERITNHPSRSDCNDDAIIDDVCVREGCLPGQMLAGACGAAPDNAIRWDGSL